MLTGDGGIDAIGGIGANEVTGLGILIGDGDPFGVATINGETVLSDAELVFNDGVGVMLRWLARSRASRTESKEVERWSYLSIWRMPLRYTSLLRAMGEMIGDNGRRIEFGILIESLSLESLLRSAVTMG
jgi:hypothetical protein